MSRRLKPAAQVEAIEWVTHLFGPRRFAFVLLAVATAATTVQLHAADAPSQDQPVKPAEESRLSAEPFREALKRRGLTELLELHLKDFPPPGIAAQHLMERDIELAVFADASRPHAERLTAIARANDILTALIEQADDDPHRFEWRFTLAHSLLYDQAQPHFTSILYRGGSKADHRRLRALTTRALAILAALSDGLTSEYKRVDTLSVREFEQLERSGFIEQIDQLGPKTGYLYSWARLYDSLARNETDPVRVRRLHAIVDYLTDNPPVLDTPHAESRIQIQALLLAGMTRRRLADHSTARSHFDRALRIADHLQDPSLAQSAAWALMLARIERIRNDRDDGRFDQALRAVSGFREFIAVEHDDSFGLRIVAALLERSIHRVRADEAVKRGLTSDAKGFQEGAFKTLAGLAQRYPARRDEIYATLYEMIGPDADPATLDPFEQCALLAGLLVDTGQINETADPLLDRAVRIGEYFLASVTDSAVALIPEVLYNIAVAQYRQGHVADAAKRFLEVARNHPSFDNALEAATHAVQLAAELYADPALQSHPELQKLYLNALELIVTRFPDSQASLYWRFYYAQFLDELGRYDEAATQYARVHTGHEHHPESMFLRIRCLALAVKAGSDMTPVDALEVHRRADEFLEAQRGFVAHVSGELARGPGTNQAALLNKRMARARVMGAEILILPHIDRPAQALETLEKIEAGASAVQATLARRIWRVRLVAYDKLGRLDEASEAIPAFIAADPAGAGPVLQSLYLSLAEKVRRLRSEGSELPAGRKAEAALVLAQQIVAWADQYDKDSAQTDRQALNVQLAEAHLATGRYKRARELFEPLVVADQGSALPTDPTDLRALLGFAEALFKLDDWSAALPRFNKLAIALPPADPIRWKSLLRDLQCRTALGHRPGDLISVVEQQRFLHPALGGPALAAEFEKLQRENQRRADAD